MITREQAVQLYGGSVSTLAADHGYKSRHAVYMWPKGEPIPESAYLKLRYQLRPEAFDAEGRLRLEALGSAANDEPALQVA